MYFDTKSVGTWTEILASNDYQAVPITVTEAVKAGMPMKNDGSKTANGSDAIGILLYDVDPADNPNGAVVVKGIVDWDKCKANNTSVLTISASEIAAKLPNIVFREGVTGPTSKTYVGGAASEAV